MKISESNFKEAIGKIGVEKLPNELQQAIHYLKNVTTDFSNWKINDSQFLKVKELAFAKLSELMSHKQGLNGADELPYIRQAKEDAAHYQFMETDRLEMIYRMELDAEIEGDGDEEERRIRRTALEKELRKRKVSIAKTKKTVRKASNKTNKPKEEYDAIKEIHFFDRFLEFRDKVLFKNTIKIFIKELQQAIEDKKIRKHSPYATLVSKVQEESIKFYNKANWANRFKISERLVDELYHAIADYDNKIHKPEEKEEIKPVQLSGFGKAKTKENILCSTDVAQMEFKTIGFTDKWLRLIGDPSPGFTAMVFGKPKMGKSYLCIEFAGYLARNFGKVLYVAKEENNSPTLTIKLRDKTAAHKNLFVAGEIPKDLSSYDFVFLDSVNSLNLTPEDLRKLKESHPGKSFVFVFQTTKDGNFRGANTFQHDVDIVIEVPERGKAVQFGRFNQGGEINIFFSEDSLPSEENVSKLDGTKPNKMKKKKIKIPAWTEPEHLSPKDHSDLFYVNKLYEEGKFEAALRYASNLDTAVRDEIPAIIWKEIGGKLTKMGEEKLKKDQAKAEKKKFQSYDERQDELNPRYMFSLTATQLLCEAIKGEFDVNYLMRKELANRGVDLEGKWVGFPKAKEIHQVE